jgi:hypothetical protein
MDISVSISGGVIEDGQFQMAKMADVKQRGRSWLTGAALIVVGVLVGQPSREARPRPRRRAAR